MLRSLLRWLIGTHQTPSLIDTEAPQVTLYARVDVPSGAARQVVSLRLGAALPAARQSSHRERLYSMRLEYTKLCGLHRCQRLGQLGIVTAGDLCRSRAEQLAGHFGSPRKATRVLKQYQRAIRFAAAVPGMMPRDALLLISIHRRSVRGLASETASALHRDLERFAESTKGRQHLRGRRIPSTRRLKRWIAQCDADARRSPLKARAA